MTSLVSVPGYIMFKIKRVRKNAMKWATLLYAALLAPAAGGEK